MNLAQLLIESAAQRPDAPALASGYRVVASYEGHATRSARLAAGLRTALGLRRGDVVALAMGNCTEYSEIMFAAWHAGCAVLPMNARLHPREFAWILDNAGAAAVFVDKVLADGLASIRDDVPGLGHSILCKSAAYRSLFEGPEMPPEKAGADDLAWLFYTSGTTGRPKGAMLSHHNLRAMTTAYFANVDSIGPNDCIIHAAPMSHGSGLYLLPHVARGACQVIPESCGFDPEECLALIDRWPGATFFLAPTMLTRLIRASGIDRQDLGNLKTIVYGGAPMYREDVLGALKVLGPRLVQIYGQGEAPMTITVLSRKDHVNVDHPRHDTRLSSVGRAQDGIEVRVVDERGATAPTGEIGEVIVRGEVVMQGYFRNAKATADTLKDGWLHTGDMGALDGDGFLTLKDRSKDLIISGGSNIYPREVEEVLLRHDGVLEASVVGEPHPDWGERVVAFIVPKPESPVREAELDELCLAHIARFKRPRAYRFLAELPKNNYGKILKTQLRALLD